MRDPQGQRAVEVTIISDARQDARGNWSRDAAGSRPELRVDERSAQPVTRRLAKLHVPLVWAGHPRLARPVAHA
eukprot:7358081-Prymnesium_polylepis.1